MPDRHIDLEKTTQTDLLYGLSSAASSGVATLDSVDAAPRRHTSDAILQHAATRADSSLTAQIDGVGVRGSRPRGRWRYPEGWAPPERKTSSVPLVVDRDEAAELVRAPLLTRMWDSCYAWVVSLAVHILFLPCLVVLSKTGPSDAWQPLLVASHSQSREVIEVLPPPQVALPIDYELPEMEPVTLEFSIPQPNIERGGMTGGIVEQPTFISTPITGPVSDIHGLFAEMGRGQARSGEESGSAVFFGLEASGNKFVFVVDCSMSMQGPRWAAAAEELNAAIDRLDENQLFYVILFDGAVHRMFNHDDRQAALFPATDQNKERFREWLATVRLGYETRPFLSVRSAVELRPDAVFLLSDGDFSDPTAEYLRKYNRPYDREGNPQHVVAVHTISFHSRLGQAVMRRIARENNGKHLFVSAK